LYVVLIFVPVIAATCGCGEQATVPQDTGGDPDGSPFYPLEIGNVWNYHSSFALGFYDTDTGAELRADTTLGVWRVELTGRETIGGVEYTIETAVVETASRTDTTWVRLRQDQNGLYRADIPRRFPPGSDELAVYTDPPPEIVRLRYPLEAGASWELFPAAFPPTATVEAADTLATPAGQLPAWRIRIDTPGRGPEDRHRVWHGRDGKIREEQHTEVIAIDELTGERVRVVTDSLLSLQNLALSPKMITLDKPKPVPTRNPNP
jgi:hypothetical protein